MVEPGRIENSARTLVVLLLSKWRVWVPVLVGAVALRQAYRSLMNSAPSPSLLGLAPPREESPGLGARLASPQ